jgi:hypothetical protein
MLACGSTTRALQPTAKKTGEYVAVLQVRGEGLERGTVTTLGELLVVSLDRLGPYRVVSPADIDALLGAEKMKDALGCDSVACAAEIGGALGARYLISPTASRMGTSLYVTLNLIDSKNAVAVARGSSKVKAHPDLYDQAIEAAVRSVLGLEPVPIQIPDGLDGSARAAEASPRTACRDGWEWDGSACIPGWAAKGSGAVAEKDGRRVFRGTGNDLSVAEANSQGHAGLAQVLDRYWSQVLRAYNDQNNDGSLAAAASGLLGGTTESVVSVVLAHTDVQTAEQWVHPNGSIYMRVELDLSRFVELVAGAGGLVLGPLRDFTLGNAESIFEVLAHSSAEP